MKPILFVDFDGTLCHDRFWRSLSPADQARIQEYLFGSHKEIVESWMMGKYISEEIHQIISKELGMPYENIWAAFVSDCRNMSVNPEALSTIEKLKERFETILITDNMDCFARFTIPSLRLDRYFDRIIDSHTMRCLKNSSGGKLFTEALKGRKDFAQCILIDNSEKTCALFEKLGGASLLVTEKRPLSHWLKSLV